METLKTKTNDLQFSFFKTKQHTDYYFVCSKDNTNIYASVFHYTNISKITNEMKKLGLDKESITSLEQNYFSFHLANIDFYLSY